MKFIKSLLKEKVKRIFLLNGKALKDKELEKEKFLLERADEQGEYNEYEQEDWTR